MVAPRATTWLSLPRHRPEIFAGEAPSLLHPDPPAAGERACAARRTVDLPPISEYRGGKARGSFVVTNQTLFPLTVVLQPKGFQVNEEGDLYDTPLDTSS